MYFTDRRWEIIRLWHIGMQNWALSDFSFQWQNLSECDTLQYASQIPIPENRGNKFLYGFSNSLVDSEKVQT